MCFKKFKEELLVELEGPVLAIFRLIHFVPGYHSQVVHRIATPHNQCLFFCEGHIGQFVRV